MTINYTTSLKHGAIFCFGVVILSNVFLLWPDHVAGLRPAEDMQVRLDTMELPRHHFGSGMRSPIFSPDRKFAPETPVAGSASKSISGPLPELAGIVWRGRSKTSLAILQMPNSTVTVFAREGQTVEGWQLNAIYRNGIDVVSGSQSEHVILNMSRRRGISPENPSGAMVSGPVRIPAPVVGMETHGRIILK